MTPKILIVDDETAHCQMLEAVLKAEKYADAASAGRTVGD